MCIGRDRRDYRGLPLHEAESILANAEVGARLVAFDAALSAWVLS